MEEWMWRGLAIAMCLAMVGMAVMPLVTFKAGIALAIYGYTHGNFPALAGGVATTGGGVAGLGKAIIAVAGMEELSGLELLGCALTGVGLGIVIG